MTTLFYNANIYPLEDEHTCYQAMLVKNGKIADLYHDIPQLDKTVKEYDCKGKTIIPSFTDSHLHFSSSAFLMGLGLCISEIKESGIVPYSLDGVRNRIADYIATTSNNMIICYGYMTCGIKEGRLPNRAELESWFPNKDISIISLDAHSSSHTTRMLNHLGFSKEHDGILSGADHEFNTGKMFELLHQELATPVKMQKAVENFLATLLNYGVTDATCLDITDDDSTNSAAELVRFANTLSPITLRLSPEITDKKRAQLLTKNQIHPMIGGCGTWELDGAIGSKSAAFDIPYLDDNTNYGELYYEQAQVDEIFKTFDDAGFQLGIHAIGTRAIDQALKAYEKVIDSTNTYRHRIEHFEFPLEEHIQKAKELGLLISVQPGYSWMDYNYQHSYDKLVDKKLFDRQVPLKRLVNMGIPLLGSSDSPVQEPNPFIQIHGMVSYPIKEQRLSVFEALRTYTFNNAFAKFEENIKGTLSINKKADFLLLSANPFDVDPASLIDIVVDEVFIDGKKVK